MLWVQFMHFFFHFFICISHGWTGTKQTVVNVSERAWPLAKGAGGSESWVDRGNYLPLNASFVLLAGVPAIKQSESHTHTHTRVPT